MVKIKDIPAKYSKAADEIEAFCGPVENKTILEVGSDFDGNLVKELKGNRGAAACTGIGLFSNMTLQDDNSRFGPQGLELLSGACLKYEDSRNMSFENNTFDIVISLAAFEHFQNLDKALLEIYRVLKPGGLLFSNFGPIWSSPVGHHLWVNSEDGLLTFSNAKLPPYCHLLMTPDQLRKHCREIYSAATTERVVDYIYNCEDQNRLLHQDYLELFHASPFDVLYQTGTSIYHKVRNSCDERYVDSFIKLHEKYGENKGFEFNGMIVLLRKPI